MTIHLEKADMNQALVSIIVPVYNAQDYIRRCIDSILDQTYLNVELLLINDGSTDDSLRICTEYAKNHSFIQVFSIENSGPSAARNLGIKESSGEFFLFIDSDDYIDKSMVERLILAFRNDCDLVMCGYTSVFRDNCVSSTLLDGTYPLHEFIASFGYYYSQVIIQYVWNKMFRAKIIKEKKVLFDTTTRRGEDALFVIEYLGYCTNIITIPEKLYYYVRNGDSLTLSYNPHLLEDQRRIFTKIRTFLEEHSAYKENEPIIENFYARRIIECLHNIFIRSNALSFQEKLFETRRIFETDDLEHSFKHYRPQKLRQKVIKLFIGKKMILCTACTFSLMSILGGLKRNVRSRKLQN